MPARRLGLAHALTWTAVGLAMTAIATDALRHDGGSSTLAFGGALAAAGAGLGLLLPRPGGARSLALSGAIAALAVAAASVLALLGEPVGVAPVAALGLAAGQHSAAMASAAVGDPALAPRVRAAPTLLAAAVGAALVAAAASLPAIPLWALLATAVVLQLIDRLVVGECRGEEVRELLTALNTGHDGGAGTLHASGLRDVPARLEALGALAGMDAVALARQAVSAFTVVLHLDRAPGGVRRISQAGRLVLTGDRLDIEEVRPW